MALAQYQSDGRFDASRTWIFFVQGLIMGTIGIAVYQAVVVLTSCWWPLRALGVVFYLFFLGGVLSSAGNSAKNRNRSYHFLCSFLLLCMLYYLNWLAFYNFWDYNNLPSGSAFVFTYDPFDLWNGIVAINQNGSFYWYSSSGAGAVADGTTLWILWGVEFIFTVFFPIPVSVDYIQEPFYPSVNRWGIKRKLPDKFACDGELPDAQAILRDDQFHWIDRLAARPDPVQIEFELYELEEQPLSYCSVFKIATTTDRKGNTSQNSVPLVKFIELTPELRKRFGEQVTAATARKPETDDTAETDADSLTGDDDSEATSELAQDFKREKAQLDGLEADAVRLEREIQAMPTAPAEPDNPYAPPTADRPPSPPIKPKPNPPATPPPQANPGDLWDD